MKTLVFGAGALLLFVGGSAAQGVDSLNLQLHGYATQGFLYTNHNSWNTTDSEDGSAAWTGAVMNVSSQPEAKLRIGIQARYKLLGDFGNKISLDWAQADYKVNERFGYRAGKVKTPVGLYNDSAGYRPGPSVVAATAVGVPACEPRLAAVALRGSDLRYGADW